MQGRTRISWITVGSILLLFCGAATAQSRDEIRLAVIVGNNVGLTHEEPLDHAEDDARRIHRLLNRIGGVLPNGSYLLLGQTAQEVMRTLILVNGRLQELSERGPTTLILYISSHADEQALHLNGTRLPLADLRRELSRLPTKFRLVLIDGCRTAVRVKNRGGRPGPHVPIALDRSASVKGEVFITSASLGEAAQEWTYLRGALFTHHLLTALHGAGDADRDGRVTLAESYTYAYRQTIAGSIQKTHRVQRPSFDFHLSGFGDWIFTRPGGLGAKLVLGSEMSGTYWIADRGNRLVAELAKVAGQPIELSVYPGWYRVVRIAGPDAYAADVNLLFGGRTIVQERDLVRLPNHPTRLRGEAPIVLRPNRVGLSYLISTPTVAGLTVQQHGALSWRRTGHDWFTEVAVPFSLSEFRGHGLSVRHFETRLCVALGRYIYSGPFEFGLALEPQLAWVMQSVHRNAEDTITEVFDIEEPMRQGLIPAIGILAQMGLPITERWWISIAISGGVQFVPLVEEGQWRTTYYLQGRTGVAFTF